MCQHRDDPGTLLLTWLDASGDRLHRSLLKKEEKKRKKPRFATKQREKKKGENSMTFRNN